MLGNYQDKGGEERTLLRFFSLCFFILLLLFLFVLSMYASNAFIIDMSMSTTSRAPIPISVKLVLSSTTPSLAKVSSQETVPPSLFTTNARLSNLAASASASGVASGGSSRLIPPSWCSRDWWWDVTGSGLWESFKSGQEANTLEEGCESRRSGL